MVLTTLLVLDDCNLSMHWHRETVWRARSAPCVLVYPDSSLQSPLALYECGETIGCLLK